MKQTGHTSQDALRKYKLPSAHHDAQVSDILQPPIPKKAVSTSESLDLQKDDQKIQLQKIHHLQQRLLLCSIHLLLPLHHLCLHLMCEETQYKVFISILSELSVCGTLFQFLASYLITSYYHLYFLVLYITSQ